MSLSSELTNQMLLFYWMCMIAGYVSNSANMMGSVNPAEPAIGVAKRR